MPDTHDLAGAGGALSDAFGAQAAPDLTATSSAFPGDGTNAKAGQTVNDLTQSGILRPSFNGLTGMADGATLTQTITRVDVNAACKPLANHAI